jgi:hypothetical protein
MERKDFLKRSCVLCGCAGLTMLAGQSLKAATGDEKEDWRVGFMQKRFSHLVDCMRSDLNEETRSKLLEQMGQFCSQQAKGDYTSFEGNLEGFLKDLESKFMEKCEYDQVNNVIRMTGKKQESCACAFAGNKNINPEFCNCSKGWMQETISVITGKKAVVTIDSAVLRGGDRCSFSVKFV